MLIIHYLQPWNTKTEVIKHYNSDDLFWGIRLNFEALDVKNMLSVVFYFKNTSFFSFFLVGY